MMEGDVVGGLMMVEEQRMANEFALTSPRVGGVTPLQIA